MMKEIVSKGYSLLEEVSKSGFFWTAFHFASHYGKLDVLKFMVNLYMDHPDKREIFNLQTVEGVSSSHSSFLGRKHLFSVQ